MNTVVLKNFLQTANGLATKNFYDVATNSVKNYLQTTEGQKYTDVLQTQKDNLLESLIKYVAGEIGGRGIINDLDAIEKIIMEQCATIANTPGCC
jgi:DNA-binding protein Fis